MSFYTALTGLNAATAQLGVTSNNIANVGTSGFKRSRADFGDIFATSPLQKASAVVGQGVSLKQVSQEFSQGNIAVSSNALDLAITGDGFFPMKSADGLQNIYTRNGSFTMNDQYNVVNSAGQALLAASVDSSGKADLGNLNRLSIPKKTTGQALQTSLVQLGLNFPADAKVITDPFNRNNPATYNKSTALTVYDQGGNGYLATVYYVKTHNASQAVPTNKWQTYVYIGETQVNAALLQATDANGEKLYVNKYGELKPYAEVSDLLVNRKTQMFSLNELTDVRSSVPATVTGNKVVASPDTQLVPNAWDLTAEHGINFSTLTTEQKLSLKDLFQLNVDDSKNPVTLDLSYLAHKDKLMNGVAIAKEMTNVLNRQFGDEHYFDFSSSNSQKFTINAGGTSLPIDLGRLTAEGTTTFGAATAAGNITVNGVTFSVALGDTAAVVAGKFKAASDAEHVAGRTVTVSGATATFVGGATDNNYAIGDDRLGATGVTANTVLKQPYLSAQQQLDFTGASASGSISVGGVAVAVAAGDTAAQVAAKVKAALDADSFITGHSGRGIEDNGDGTLLVSYAIADGNPAEINISDSDTAQPTGVVGQGYILAKSYAQLDKLTTDDMVVAMQQKIDLAIANSANPNLRMHVAYDRATQGFKFTEDGGTSLTLRGGTDVAQINSVLGLSANEVTTSEDGSGSYVATGETVPNGGLIRTASDQRYGLTVEFDSVTQKFSLKSGTTGDQSSLKVSGANAFAGSAFGIVDNEVTTSNDAVRGIRSTPAVTMGSAIAINVNNNFSVDSTNNRFIVTVDDVKGEVVLPPNANYTLDGFMAELQSRINLLANDSGSTVSGVKVEYDRQNNAFKFTSGTASSNSFIKVSGSATWGLTTGDAGRGVTSSWIKPTQFTDYSSGLGVKKYINDRGEETSSADGYTTLPEWSPVYLDKGELTFDTAGKLVSPRTGAQLDTVFLPDGKGSLRINIDYSKSTQYSSPFAVLSQSQDGAPEGDLVGVNIGDDGLVNASYSNGSQQSLGKIVLVNFSNPNGLRQIGDSSYYSSSSSGTPKFGEAGGAGFGTIRAGARERANVDLTQELVDLITAQRNFQANAKAIETSTALTQSIIQIRN
jgi:flagellar hook-basal body protein